MRHLWDDHNALLSPHAIDHFAETENGHCWMGLQLLRLMKGTSLPLAVKPTTKYFPVRSNLQKFYSLKSHKSVLASSRL